MLEEQQQAVNDRVRAIYQKAQTRLGELVRVACFQTCSGLSRLGDIGPLKTGI